MDRGSLLNTFYYYEQSSEIKKQKPNPIKRQWLGKIDSYLLDVILNSKEYSIEYIFEWERAISIALGNSSKKIRVELDIVIPLDWRHYDLDKNQRLVLEWIDEIYPISVSKTTKLPWNPNPNEPIRFKKISEDLFDVYSIDELIKYL